MTGSFWPLQHPCHRNERSGVHELSVSACNSYYAAARGRRADSDGRLGRQGGSRRQDVQPSTTHPRTVVSCAGVLRTRLGSTAGKTRCFADSDWSLVHPLSTVATDGMCVWHGRVIGAFGAPVPLQGVIDLRGASVSAGSDQASLRDEPLFQVPSRG